MKTCLLATLVLVILAFAQPAIAQQAEHDQAFDQSTGCCAARTSTNDLFPETGATLPADSQTEPGVTPPPPKETPNPLEDRRDRIWYPGDTESLKPLLIKLGGNILLDQKDI